jgi:hypothetical protein
MHPHERENLGDQVELLFVMLIIAVVVMIAILLARLLGKVDQRHVRQRKVRAVYMPAHLVLHRAIVLVGKSTKLDAELLTRFARRVIESQNEEDRVAVEKEFDEVIGYCTGFSERVQEAISFDHRRIKQLPRASRLLICRVRHHEWFQIGQNVSDTKRKLEDLRANLYGSS